MIIIMSTKLIASLTGMVSKICLSEEKKGSKFYSESGF